MLLVRTNHPEEAEAAYRRALHIDEGVPGGSADLGRDLNELAELLRASGRLAEAEGFYVRALAVDEARLGPQHRDVARDLNNLARLLSDEGKNGEAESLQRRAVDILQAVQRENPAQSTSDLASALNNLASDLPRERLAEAQSLYRRALALNEESFGADNPNVAVSLNNLGDSLRLSESYAEAEVLLLRALHIDEEALGAQSPTVAVVLGNLAKVLRDTNRRAEAQSLFERALEIDQSSFGPMHPAVARDLKNLAKLYKIANRSVEAAPLIARVIDILREMQRKSGRPAVEIGPALNFQAQILADTGQFAGAEDAYRQALRLDEENHGRRSAQVARDLKGLVDVLTATRRRQEATPLLRRARAISAARQRSTSDAPCARDHCHVQAAGDT